MNTALYEFESFLRENGLNPDVIEADSKKRRCATVDHSKKKNAEYCLHPESEGWSNGWFRNYETQTFLEFKFKDKTITRPEDEEAARKRREAAKHKREERERDDRARREKTSKRAARIWNQAKPVDAHPYLEKKGISAHGVKQLSGRELRRLGCYEVKSFPHFEELSFIVIPVWNIHRKLVSLQVIAPGGEKRFLKNGMKRAGFFVLCPENSSLQDFETVYMCEGYATGESILAAVNAPVIVAFDAGNLGPVMDAFKMAFPDKAFTLCADNDEAKHQAKGKPINPGIKAALDVCRKYPDVSLTFPTFQDISKLPTDFNDLHQGEGLDQVKKYLSAATQTTFLLEDYLNSETAKTLCFMLPGQHLSDVPEMKNVLQFSDLAIYAGPGAGKSYFTLNMLPSLLPKYEKLIAFSPKRILASQKAKDTATGVTLHVIKGGSHYDPAQRVQTSTYNGSDKVFTHDQERITAVIDECHDTTTSQGYRPDVIEAMQADIQGCKRRVWMTATPAPAGKVYAVEHEFFVFAHLQRREIETVRTSNKLKTLVNTYGKTPGTKLVYCYKTKTAEELTEKTLEMGYKADYIISRTEQDGVYKTAAHRGLVEEQKIDKENDYVFVSSYPAEGVDILDHNISHVILFDAIAPWLLFQLVNRTRKADSIPIIRLQSYDAAKKPKVNLNWSAKTEQKHFDELHSIADGFAKTLTELSKVKNKSEALKVYQTLAKKWSACLSEHSGTYTTRENLVRFKVYQIWERYCRTSDTMFLHELAKYNIFEKKAIETAENQGTPGAENSALLTDEEEKAIETRIKDEKEQRFHAELVCAAGLSDAELEKESPKDTDAKKRLATLYRETGDFEQAVKILKKIGSNKRKYRMVLDQLAIQHYYESEGKDAMLEQIRKISKKKITGEEAETILKGIYKKHSFLAETLERPDLTPVRAIQDLQKFFELKRHTSRNGAYYGILSQNPLLKYNKTRITGELKERMESRTFLENQSNHVDTFFVDVPKEPECKSVYILPALSGESHVLASEFAREQERIYGKVF